MNAVATDTAESKEEAYDRECEAHLFPWIRRTSSSFCALFGVMLRPSGMPSFLSVDICFDFWSSALSDLTMAPCNAMQCSPGMQVRAYTAKNVFQDLKVARDEFIQASVYIQKETKVYLPKLACHFAREMSLSTSGLLEMVCACLPELQQKAIRTCIKGRADKYIYWVPRSSAFRYLIRKEVVQGGYPLNWQKERARICFFFFFLLVCL